MGKDAVRFMLEDAPQSLKGTPLLVMIALAERANDDTWVCWPGLADIATRAHVSKRSVQRSLQGLEQAGYLAITRGLGAGHTSQYRIEADVLLCRAEQERSGPEKVTLLTPFSAPKKVTSGAEKVTQATPFGTEKGDIRGQKKVTTGAKKGDIAVSPEPVLTRIINQDESKRESESKSSVRTREGAPPFSSVLQPVPKAVSARPPAASGPPGQSARNGAHAPPAATSPGKGFVLTEELRAWFGEIAPGLDLDRTVQKFLAHHRAQGSTFADWGAAFEKWVLDEIDFEARRKGNSAGGSNGNGQQREQRGRGEPARESRTQKTTRLLGNLAREALSLAEGADSHRALGPVSDTS